MRCIRRATRLKHHNVYIYARFLNGNNNVVGELIYDGHYLFSRAFGGRYINSESYTEKFFITIGILCSKNYAKFRRCASFMLASDLGACGLLTGEAYSNANSGGIYIWKPFCQISDLLVVNSTKIYFYILIIIRVLILK